MTGDKTLYAVWKQDKATWYITRFADYNSPANCTKDCSYSASTVVDGYKCRASIVDSCGNYWMSCDHYSWVMDYDMKTGDEIVVTWMYDTYISSYMGSATGQLTVNKWTGSESSYSYSTEFYTEYLEGGHIGPGYYGWTTTTFTLTADCPSGIMFRVGKWTGISYEDNDNNTLRVYIRSVTVNGVEQIGL